MAMLLYVGPVRGGAAVLPVPDGDPLDRRRARRDPDAVRARGRRGPGGDLPGRGPPAAPDRRWRDDPARRAARPAVRPASGPRRPSPSRSCRPRAARDARPGDDGRRTPRAAATSHWSVTGPADAPPIVFVHGAMMGRSVWWPQVEALSDRFRCVTRRPARSRLAEGPEVHPRHRRRERPRGARERSRRAGGARGPVARRLRRDDRRRPPPRARSVAS